MDEVKQMMANGNLKASSPDSGNSGSNNYGSGNYGSGNSGSGGSGSTSWNSPPANDGSTPDSPRGAPRAYYDRFLPSSIRKAFDNLNCE